MHTGQANEVAGPLAWLNSAPPAWNLSAVMFALALAGLVCLPICAWLALRLGETQRARPQQSLENFRVVRRDPLTGLFNRHGLAEALSRLLKSGRPAALMLVNIDGFSRLNDSYGHEVGDQVLVAVADRLRSQVPCTSQLARLGGDEFALLLDASSGLALVEAAALGVQRALMAPLQAGQQSVSCSASLGIALTPGHASTVDGLLRAANAALNDMKAAGGGNWRFFDPEKDTVQHLRAQLKNELRAAVAAGQIVPLYQPIMDLRSNALTGLEVLARWQHPTRGVLPPDLFIPMAEEMQLAGQITQSLMRRVIRDAQDWPDWLYFAFNVSPGQLRELISMIRNPPNWPEGQLDPRRIEVEITENALIEDVDVARELIALLQGRGTRVVLDDFGIGYSNFFHLRELPFDRIKIDKSFVLDMATDPRADACVRAMLALGASLGIDMVAEGLESAEAEACVAALGCRFGQGYLYSQPVPGSAIPAMMRRLRILAASPTKLKPAGVEMLSAAS